MVSFESFICGFVESASSALCILILCLASWSVRLVSLLAVSRYPSTQQSLLLTILFEYIHPDRSISLITIFRCYMTSSGILQQFSAVMLGIRIIFPYKCLFYLYFIHIIGKTKSHVCHWITLLFKDPYPTRYWNFPPENANDHNNSVLTQLRVELCQRFLQEFLPEWVAMRFIIWRPVRPVHVTEPLQSWTDAGWRISKIGP